jgi:hypothetical protein
MFSDRSPAPLATNLDNTDAGIPVVLLIEYRVSPQS